MGHPTTSRTECNAAASTADKPSGTAIAASVNDAARRLRAPEFDQLDARLRVITDLEGIYQVVHPEFATLLATTPADMVGRHYQHYLVPEHLSVSNRARDQIAAGQRLSGFVNCVRGADGVCHWLAWEACLSTDGQSIMAAAVDLSGQQQLIEQLQGRARVIAEFADELTVGMLEIDRLGVITWANPSAAAMLGGREVIGQRWCHHERLLLDRSGGVRDVGDDPVAWALQGTPVTGDTLGIACDFDSDPRWVWCDARPRPNGVVMTLVDITDQVAAERRQAEAQRIAHVGHWAWVPDQSLVTASDQHLVNLGRDHEPLGGQPDIHFSSLVAADRATMVADINNLLAGGRRVDRDVRVVGPNGERWLRLSTWAEHRINGAVARIVGISCDVTEQRLLESALRQAEAQAKEEADLHLAGLEASADAVVITDASGRVEYVNPAFTKLTGYQGYEALGQNPRILKSPATPRSVHAGMWRTICSGRVWRGELINRRRDGTDYHERMVITPIRDLEGVIAHYIAIKEDISDQVAAETERAAAAAALARAHDKAAFVIDAMPSVLIALDGDGVVTDWNRFARDCFGLTSDQAVGKPLLDLAIDWDRSRLRQAMAELDRDGYATMPQLPYRRSTGSAGVAGFQITRIDGGSAGGAGSIWVGSENTNDAAAEASRLHAQKMESIGQLSSGIAHEINTPIQYVGDNLRFLAEAGADLMKLAEAGRVLAESAGEAGRAFREIADAIDLEFLASEAPSAAEQALEGVARVARIVGAMKEFAHPDAESIGPCDCNQLVESTTVVARNEYKYVADLELDLDSSLPPVLCNGGSINQVLLNLLVNAAHAIGGVVGASGDRGTITIATQAVSAGDRVRITVADTGTGVPAEIRDRIFDPFFTTKDVGKGTGQGLALAHNVVVAQHHGTISIEDNQPRGARFVIELPTAGRSRSEVMS